MKRMNSKQIFYYIQYQEQVLNWQLWIKQADELLAASKKLEPSIKKYWLNTTEHFDPIKGTYSPLPGYKPKQLLQGIYFMLTAYAIENLLKAILIRQSTEDYKREVMRTHELPKDLKEHDLMVLINKTNLKTNQTEINLLSRLYRSSVWQGRYPVPVKAVQLTSIVMHGEEAHFTAFLAPNDIPNLKLLIKRIRKHIGT
jgi:hypothetical protein